MREILTQDLLREVQLSTSEIEISGNASTSSAISVAAQVPATDTAGMFLAAFKHTDNGAYANVHSSDTSGNWAGQQKISESGETVENNEIKCAMAPNGNGLIVWKNSDSNLRGVFYSAASNTYSEVLTLDDGIDNIGNVQAGSDSTLTVVYNTTPDTAKVYRSITVTPTNGWKCSYDLYSYL